MAQMRDFDQEIAERIERLGLPQFKLGGRTWTLRDDVRPEIVVLWDSLGPGGETSQADKVRLIDEVWCEVLVPEQADAYHEMRAGAGSPGLLTLISAAEWALEQITARPSEPSADSGSSERTAGSMEPPLRAVAGESAPSASATGST